MSLYRAIEQGMPEQVRWRFRAGMAAFFALSWLLAAGLCDAAHGPCVGGIGAFPVTVLVVAIEAWLVFALASGKGRRVAAGFLTALAVATVLTGGRLLALWGLPFAGVAEVARPLWAPLAEASARSTRAEQWAGEHRAQLPTVVHAQRLANQLHECAARYRMLDSLSSLPRDPAQLAEPTYCAELARTRATEKPDPSWYGAVDYGWRWSYLPGTADSSGKVSAYTIRVFEDAAIGRPAPQYEGDESGIVRQLEAGKPPVLVSTPVPGLAQLRACLQRVPAQHEKDEASYRYQRPSDPMYEVVAVCPELKGHYYVDTEGSSFTHTGRLALSATNAGGEFIDTVAVYAIDFVPADVGGLIFELQARPTTARSPYVHSGVRRFFVARDGSIHWSTGQGAAVESDPIVVECTLSTAIGCGDSPPVPQQAPGS